MMPGDRPGGTKELIAIEDGYRESTESWATVLRGLKRWGKYAVRIALVVQASNDQGEQT